MSVREALQSIYDVHGELTAGLVVDLARDPHHPLHDKFEWDDKVAGEQYRLSQARKIIAKVKVRYVDPSDETHTIRARVYHSVPTSQGMAYRTTDDVMSDPFARRLLRQRMRRDFEALMARYKDMDELYEMIKNVLDERLDIAA